MKYNSIKRRHFLQGLGASLALPLLPSLMSRANAAESLPTQKYFIYMGEEHGGINIEHLYPINNPGNEQVLYSGSASAGLDHRTRMEALQNFLTTRSGGLFPTSEQELSPVLGSFLNPHLDKINLIRGLDIMFYAGHHGGCFLGNFAGRVSNNDPSLLATETIDNVMAGSSSFYQTAPILPVMDIFQVADGSSRGLSWKNISGSVQQRPRPSGNQSIINAILGAEQPIATPAEMTDYLNLIHADYNNLVSGAYGASRRLSTQDRLRVEEHIALLNQLSAKISAQGGLSCSAEFSDVERGSWNYWDKSQVEKVEIWDMVTDTIVAAIKCGSSRVATISTSPHAQGELEGDNGYHTLYAHRVLGDANPTVLRGLVENSRFTAENIFTPLVEKLDVDRGDGTTYLDNALVAWGQESGPITHDPQELFALTAGSAGGYFNTGNYVDYRNLSSRALENQESGGRALQLKPGLPYNRWLYTMLKSMGVPDADFARPGIIGYADNYRNTGRYASWNGHTAWPERLLADMGTPMPRIVA